MITDLTKCPFPWFGGKRDAAPIVWQALGDPAHYVEPFHGSLAALLCRPHEANRTYYSETVNDLDCHLTNFWRAIQSDPDAVAAAASWPVSEVDLMARHLALVKWGREIGPELRADPDKCDPKMAGWWAWGQSSWIGTGWCAGTGPWAVDADGRVFKQSGRRGPAREPGVTSKLPHLGGDGRGVNHAGCREPGVTSQLPHLGDDGRGVNRPQLKEPGVTSQLPHLANDGQGVNHAGCREPGTGDAPEFHPMTMPELLRWFRFLSARLRHVRILNGPWERAVTNGALKTIPVRSGKGVCGVFLDPPYGDVRTANVYAHDSLTVSGDVRDWCLAHGDDPSLRIVLAGFTGEGHETLTAAGWREVEWFKSGFLKGGMANVGGTNSKQKQERLWLSPHCLPLEEKPAEAPKRKRKCQGELW